MGNRKKKKKIIFVEKETKKMVTKSNKEKKFFISLPVPEKDIIMILIARDSSELVIERYFECIRLIGDKEAETLKHIAKIKYNAIWKTLLVISVVICLVVGMTLGVTLNGAYNKFSFGALPVKNSK